MTNKTKKIYHIKKEIQLMKKVYCKNLKNYMNIFRVRKFRKNKYYFQFYKKIEYLLNISY